MWKHGDQYFVSELDKTKLKNLPAAIQAAIQCTLDSRAGSKRKLSDPSETRSSKVDSNKALMRNRSMSLPARHDDVRSSVKSSPRGKIRARAVSNVAEEEYEDLEAEEQHLKFKKRVRSEQGQISIATGDQNLPAALWSGHRSYRSVSDGSEQRYAAFLEPALHGDYKQRRPSAKRPSKEEQLQGRADGDFERIRGQVTHVRFDYKGR